MSTEMSHQLTKWVKKIHMYLGLLNFTILVIWGIVGLSVSFLPPPSKREKAEPEIHHVAYETPVGISDRELADHAYEKLRLPLTSPAPDWSIWRDRHGNLLFRLPTLAKYQDVAVLKEESRLRVTNQSGRPLVISLSSSRSDPARSDVE